jgi:hypothetical protein
MSSYALRLPESLKAASKRIAAADDTTMNQFFVVAIAEKISAMETADFFQRRASQGTKAKADKAWGKVGNKNSVPEDRWTTD